MPKEKPRGRGRPPLNPAERRRNNVTIRMRDALKDQLQADANANGRSLSEEIEVRLEASFGADDTAVGGAIEIIARVMRETGQHAGFTVDRTLEGASEWYLDPFAFDQAAQGVHQVIEALRPPGKIVPPKFPKTPKGSDAPDLNGIYQTLGVGFANGAIRAIAHPDESSGGELQRWGVRIRAKLGRFADNLIAKEDKKNG
ncbi:MAG: hypothetical protein RIM84_20925 [Alphaproteobacteria bacterium]